MLGLVYFMINKQPVAKLSPKINGYAVTATLTVWPKKTGAITPGKS
jgi:hypothetical protein